MASEVSNQAIFLEECRRDPEFRNRALGLERMLCVKAQNETNIRDFDNGVDSDSVSEPVRSSELVVGAASVEASERAATAGESQRIIGLRERYESDFLSVDACARALALPAASASLSSSAFPSASLAVVAHARSTPMHGAHNSWSDTGRVQGPMGRRCTKVGGSGPAEDLRPVSEVAAGVNFRPAGRCTGAGCRFTSREATRHRYQASQGKCGHTFPPPGGSWYPNSCHLDTDWTSGNQWAGRRCVETTQSGIWVLKGNAITRMLPENLDYLWVGWISRGTYETAWVTPGHDCLCSYQYGTWSSSQTTN